MEPSQWGRRCKKQPREHWRRLVLWSSFHTSRRGRTQTIGPTPARHLQLLKLWFKFKHCLDSFIITRNTSTLSRLFFPDNFKTVGTVLKLHKYLETCLQLERDRSRQWCTPHPHPPLSCLSWKSPSICFHWSWSCLGRCSETFAQISSFQGFRYIFWPNLSLCLEIHFFYDFSIIYTHFAIVCPFFHSFNFYKDLFIEENIHSRKSLIIHSKKKNY